MAGLRVTISPQFSVTTELLHLSFCLADVRAASVSRKAGSSIVTLPESSWSGSLSRSQQLWLHRVVTEELRLFARSYLPKRLYELAASVGIDVSGVTIKNLSSRWGSCSTRRHINLSLWLMLAPPRLIDYVMYHELTHVSEMNHGPRFWALLDTYTEGCARQLDREMKQFGKSLLNGDFLREEK